MAKLPAWPWRCWALSCNTSRVACAGHLQRCPLERKPAGQRYFVARPFGGSADDRWVGSWNGHWRRQMHFAVSHDAIPAERPAETYERSLAKQRRASTTATVLALAVCVVTVKGPLLEARTSSHNAAVAKNVGTAPVTIVAPEFCKDQTWPYIDSRCLRRVDNPPPPADDHKAIAPPVTTAAVTPVPDGVSANADAAPPANTEAAASTSTPPAAPAPSPTDRRAQVIQSVFPTADLPQRAITIFSLATPTPQPICLPISAPAMFHSIIGRGIGVTILAFSDFASS